MDFCPFTNKPCSNAKVIHVTDILNGEAQQMHLCQICASKYLDANPVQPTPKEDPILEISKMIAKEIVAKIEKSILLEESTKGLSKKYNENKCPGCGISEQEILNHGRLGCAVCYDHFKKLIDQIIVKCQDGETMHVGKVPKHFQDNPSKSDLNFPHTINASEKIKILESKMQKAIEVENYEIAHMLKLKIQELKKSINCDS